MDAKQYPQPDHSPSDSDQSPAAGQPEHPNAFPIVGIGASAGGLAAFSELLNYLPTDTGMAFVLVQHLDPTQKSLLTEILARTTTMPVREVEEGMVIAPNYVYVIPSNTTMTIAQGVLHLMPRGQSQKVSMSIDGFFCSLAGDQGSKAIGVVLSGGNADGSIGLAAIKSAGGITFAQSEDSAQVSNMPNTAIALGHVDFILPPAEIAAKLAHISRHPYVTSPTPAVPPLESTTGKDSLTIIFNLLRAATKVDFTHYKHTTIKRRIFRRMALYRLEQLDEYVRYLQAHKAEVQALYQEILINVTSFFRDADAFATLKEAIFPNLVLGRPADLPLRIWVAGCATGEEAYSIAMCLLEYLADRPHPPQVQIFATDVSERAIEIARLGMYQPSQVGNVSPDRLQRFFTQVAGGYQINKSVRELCIFARQNLISDPPFSRLDLISCRNVFIYFGATLQKKVLAMFHYGLMPGGLLLLGTSETVAESPDLFTLVDRKSKVYAKQSSSLQLDFELIPSGYPAEPISPVPIVAEGSKREATLAQAADQIVLQQYAPVGVVINAQLEILQFRGQTGPYLEPSPGRASLNLLQMVKDGLRLSLRTAIHQAKQDGQAVCFEDIPLRERPRPTGSARPRQVRIDVIPFKPTATSEACFLVLFADQPTPPSMAAPPSSQPSLQLTNQSPSLEQLEIQRLQQELDTTKAYLQSIIEEQQSSNQDLRAANEEILSSNEELQSTNEELQTAKEEIQATNEELSTINDELYRRNSETTQVSNDLQNVLGSIHIPILMLASDLRIRRFTTTATSMFNLIPTDIGRPLSDIKHTLNLADLEQQILAVINTLEPYTQEVQALDGHWYDLRIRPYRTLDNRIDGAVMVLVDIDTLKRSRDQVREARDYAEAIVQTIHEPLVVLNADLQVVTANPAFYETFQVSPSETEQCLIFDLGNGQWNIPRLRSLLEDLLPQNTQIQEFAVEHEFEHIGRQTMVLNARRMPQLEGTSLILLAIENLRHAAATP